MLAGGVRLHASNHLLHIEEVMAGANGNSQVQFIIIEQGAVGQHLWGPQGGETQARAQLVFFDATGRETGIFKFPSDPPTGGTLDVLIATQAFAELTGAPTPDVIIPPLVIPISGRVCFRANPGNPVFPFTDDPLVPGTTVIKAVHFIEIRDRIDEQLLRFLQPVHAYSRALAAGATIRGEDVEEMYAAVNSALLAAGEPPVVAPTVDPGATTALASHITTLRDAVMTLEALWNGS